MPVSFAEYLQAGSLRTGGELCSIIGKPDALLQTITTSEKGKIIVRHKDAERLFAAPGSPLG